MGNSMGRGGNVERKAAEKQAKRNRKGAGMGYINTSENSKKYEGIATLFGLVFFAGIITAIVRVLVLQDSQRVPTVFLCVCFFMYLPLLAEKFKPWAEGVRRAQKIRADEQVLGNGER